MKKITFNQHYGIADTDTEHLNILMDQDIEAFIDPYHIANNLNNMIAKKMYIRSKSFLKTLNQTYIIPNDYLSGLSFLSHLHEANEYHLGYSHNNKGKGIGATKAETIFSSLSANKYAKSGVTITNEAHNVLLLVRGIGQDLMSDTLANICRDILAEFTLKQCIKYGIKVYETNIKYYDHSSKNWMYKSILLPKYRGKHIILVPQFLTSGGRIYQNHYNWFVSSNHIARDIMEGNLILSNNVYFIQELKNGSKKAIVKNIYKEFRKPKDDLIEFVNKYNGSLIDFQDHVKENYPAINRNKLIQLHSKAS